MKELKPTCKSVGTHLSVELIVHRYKNQSSFVFAIGKKYKKEWFYLNVTVITNSIFSSCTSLPISAFFQVASWTRYSIVTQVIVNLWYACAQRFVDVF